MRFYKQYWHHWDDMLVTLKFEAHIRQCPTSQFPQNCSEALENFLCIRTTKPRQAMFTIIPGICVAYSVRLYSDSSEMWSSAVEVWVTSVRILAIPSGMNNIPIAVVCRDLGAATSANSNPTVYNNSIII